MNLVCDPFLILWLSVLEVYGCDEKETIVLGFIIWTVNIKQQLATRVGRLFIHSLQSHWYLFAMSYFGFPVLAVNPPQNGS